MTTALVLADRDGPDVSVGPDQAQRLAELGVTRISVLGDSAGFGIVLEGWAFDPAHVEAAARVLCSGTTDPVRILREVEAVALAASLADR